MIYKRKRKIVGERSCFGENVSFGKKSVLVSFFREKKMEKKSILVITVTTVYHHYYHKGRKEGMFL